ncbi:hypothetical protein [Hyperthermus butylicus]|uniref:hypothetical protein n=1 Tax=Hyperthermus butylicus TaxID=54248 RepID=UPI00129B5923|nr:hypothetical protein [Hyperthermus butylicus]
MAGCRAYPLHVMLVFEPYAGGGGCCTVSSYLSLNGLNLPSGPKIGDEEVVYVAETLKRIHRELSWA